MTQYRRSLMCFVILAIGVCSGARETQAAARKPNVVILLADDKAYNEAVPRGSAVRNAIFRNKSAIPCLTANW
jgi:hypothetical protein